MNASDLLCVPSVNEGRPNVIYEAMACGVPTVASKVGGVGEILVNEKLGVLVPPRNVDEITRAVLRSVNRTWDHEYMRKHALKHDSRRYVQKIKEIYEDSLVN
jgi:glycosyltransferase involved in cell wall biosynthesis